MSIRPRGWLLAQMKNDIDNGLAGHLENLSVFCHDNIFNSAVPMKDKQSWLDAHKAGTPWWSGEIMGNWLNGLARLAWLTGDASGQATAKRQVKLALDGGDPVSGYLGMYSPSERFQSPARPVNAEPWTQTCLLRALWSYADVTNDKALRQRIEKAVDLTIGSYGPTRPYFEDLQSVRGGRGARLGLRRCSRLQETKP